MSENRGRGNPKTAAEFRANLSQDPNHAAGEQKAEENRQRSVEAYQLAASELLAELAGIGFVVDSVGELRRGGPYPEAVPLLLRWLSRVEYGPLKEDIVRTLSMPWATTAAPVLVTLFEQTEAAGLRWAIGNALEVLAADALADDLLRLATNRTYGRAREMVVLALGKLTDLRVVPVLVELLADEEIVGHAVMALGLLRAKTARTNVEALLHHDKAWIRREARGALDRMDKAP